MYIPMLHQSSQYVYSYATSVHPVCIFLCYISPPRMYTPLTISDLRLFWFLLVSGLCHVFSPPYVHFHYQLPVMGFIKQDGKYKTKLQALVYDILPSTTAVFSYAIGSRKLSANEQFFCVCCCWCSNSSKFVTNN